MNKTPFLIILTGIPFAGKTFLAKKLATDLGAVRVDLDEIKFNLLGEEIKDQEIIQTQWDDIYQKMYQQIELELKSNKLVVHDTGNFTAYERQLVIEIAKKMGIKFITIWVDYPVELAKKRLLVNRKTQIRFDISDQEFESAVAEMQWPTKQENFFRYQAEVDNYQQLIKFISDFHLTD